MVEKLYSLLSTFTDEAKDAALAKVKELKIDPNRGPVSLDESYINLETSVQILKDAIEKKKLVQLPITIQRTLEPILVEIQRAQTSLAAGNDEVVNLGNGIEQLYTAIWEYGLNNLSDEVLGYQKKLNQLKNEQVELKRLRKEIEDALPLKKQLAAIHSNASSVVSTLEGMLPIAQQNSEAVAQLLAKTTETDQKVSAVLATAQQQESSSNQLLAGTKSANTEVVSLTSAIREFHKQIEDYRTKLTDAVAKASETVAENDKATKEILARLNKLEDEIKVQIEKATGFSLFHSFQTRQLNLARGKNRWVLALVCLVFASLGLTGYLAATTQSVTVGFWLKLSLTVPLIYAIAFCSVQYSRERRLEEEYAFKSSISISLVPYQELVGKLVEEDNPKEVEKYTAFIIDSISKVFTSPTHVVFESHTEKGKFPAEAVKQLSEALAPLVKALKP